MFMNIMKNQSYLRHFMFFITLFTISRYSLGNTDNSSNREKYKVIIVGAGISGIGAATRLLSNNFTDIAVLEASNRLGGRVYTAPFGDFLIEYGAQWVHGQVGNAVYKIAEPYNFLYVQNWDPKTGYVIHSDSKINVSVVSDWLFEKAYGLFSDSEEMIKCNCSMEHYFDTKFEELIKNNKTDKYTSQAVADYVKKAQSVHDGTRNLGKEGSLGNTYYITLNGSSTVAWRTGYYSLINMLTGKYEGQELPLLEKTKFNKVVQSINWTGDEIELTCEDGSHYFSDHVIVTVSLGVLKHSAKTMFNPPLPDYKLSAIESLGFDIVNKIFIQFNTRWWPLDYEFKLTFLWSNEDKERFTNESIYGGWTTEIAGFHYVENQPRVLEGWISGDVARKVETLSDEEVTGAIVEVLNWFVGNKYTISQPINITRSSWASNRFVRGSYSFRTLDSDYMGYSASDIAEPISLNKTNPVVLFAGEASHEKFFSTVHGALEAGWREATRILNFS